MSKLLMDTKVANSLGAPARQGTTIGDVRLPILILRLMHRDLSIACNDQPPSALSAMSALSSRCGTRCSVSGVLLKAPLASSATGHYPRLVERTPT